MKLFESFTKKNPSFFKKPGRVLLFTMSILVLNSCATKPISVSTRPLLDFTVDPDISILILKPFLKFERIHDESILSGSEYQGKALEMNLLIAAKDTVKSRNLTMIDCRNTEDEILELCNQLHTLSPKLSKGIITDKTRILLKQLAAQKKRQTILVHMLRVKVGPGGSWDPNTGAIRSAMSSSVLQASLINCDTEKVVWKTQVLLRQVPNVKDPQFSESLKLLYQTFPNRKEQ